MNIQQFKYILAVAESRHFETAARKTFISQSTLSTMISKFEKEIGITIFDRKKKPVEVTSEGKRLIEQLKIITREIEQLEEVSKAIKGEVSGDLTISVIPTIAPFLLPLFIQDFATKFPNLNIQVREQTTSEIIRHLKSRTLDIGILSIPIMDKDIQEIKLYDEPFLFYGSGQIFRGYKELGSLDRNQLCLLEEGHCMRTQIINLCDTSGLQKTGSLNFEYKAGSIDSLLRFVKTNNATTLLPHLATIDLAESDRLYLSPFVNPQPFRSVGIVVHRHFVKNRILEVLKRSIIEKVENVLPALNMEGIPLRPV